VCKSLSPEKIKLGFEPRQPKLQGKAKIQRPSSENRYILGEGNKEFILLLILPTLPHSLPTHPHQVLLFLINQQPQPQNLYPTGNPTPLTWAF
jgi:hypothetical protein